MQQSGVCPVVFLPLQSLGVASATSEGLPEATEGDRTAFPGHGTVSSSGASEKNGSENKL